MGLTSVSGSLADTAAHPADVRFAPDSDQAGYVSRCSNEPAKAARRLSSNVAGPCIFGCSMISPRPDVAHQPAPKCASGLDDVSKPRKIVAWSIRSAGFLLGTALVSFYLFMAWDSPPDMSNARPRAIFNFYVTGPLLLFCGPMLLAGWVASRVDHRRLSD